MRQCDGLARAGLSDDDQIAPARESLPESESGRPVYGGQLRPGGQVWQCQGDRVFSTGRAAGLYSRRGREESRLDQNFVEGKEGCGKVHSLGMTQRDATMVLLNIAHPPSLGLFALTRQILANLPPKRPRSGDSPPEDRRDQKAKDE